MITTRPIEYPPKCCSCRYVPSCKLWVHISCNDSFCRGLQEVHLRGCTGDAHHSRCKVGSASDIREDEFFAQYLIGAHGTVSGSNSCKVVDVALHGRCLTAPMERRNYDTPRQQAAFESTSH